MSVLRRRRGRAPRGRAAVAVVVVLAAVTVSALGAGEFAAGRLIRDRIAAAAPALGSDLQVRESGWALWDVARQHIPQLDLSSDDATLGRLGPVDVQARLDDVRLGGGAPTVGGTTARLDVPAQAVADAVQAAAASVTVDAVTADPGSGTLGVALGPGGAVRLTLRPALKDGRVVVTAVSATVLGQPLPSQRLAALTDRLGRQAQRSYPLGLRATSVRVVADGLRIDLRGGPVRLPQV